MSTHKTTVRWSRQTSDFKYETYNRDHDWKFGSGSVLQASAAPEYQGNRTLPNPEEALVAALSSCHMLTFLAVAAKKGFIVNSYEDDAMGYLEKNASGRLAITKVELRPRIVFNDPKIPNAMELEQLHQQAHKGCFIANSVQSEVVIYPQS